MRGTHPQYQTNPGSDGVVVQTEVDVESHGAYYPYYSGGQSNEVYSGPQMGNVASDVRSYK